jgi:hypothetical protein
MSMNTRIWMAGVIVVTLLAPASAGSSGAEATAYAGDVVSVDKTAGKIVIADMGPALGDGRSQIVQRSIQVTPSTEFVRVTRATGPAPSGYAGDFIETRVAPWQVNPGDYVAVTVKPERGGSQALKVTIVDTGR